MELKTPSTEQPRRADRTMPPSVLTLLGLLLAISALGVQVWLWNVYVTCEPGSSACVSIPEAPIFPAPFLVLAAVLGSIGSVLLVQVHRMRPSGLTRVVVLGATGIDLANLGLCLAVLAGYLDVYRDFNTAMDRGGILALVAAVVLGGTLVSSLLLFQHRQRLPRAPRSYEGIV